MTNFNLNLRGDFFNDWSRQINPLVKIDHQINDDWSLMVSGAGSYRLPTFTDLYYVSPANIGNENLTPETAATYETGVCYEKKQHKLMLNIFYRDADDIIDWTRNNSADPWQADNISRTKTIGSEAEWDFIINYKNRFLNLEKTSLGYAYLNTSYSQKEAMEVKYTSDYLKHKVVFEAYLEYPFMLKQSLKLRYNRRISDEDYFLLDTKISKGFIKEKYSAEVYLSASNIFNTSYCEVRDVAMPGRWIESGVKITF
jgi:iron complex outermembrane receptor protein